MCWEERCVACFTVAFGAASADRQERDGTAAAVAALVVVFALGLEEHQRRLVVMVVAVVVVMVVVIVVVLIAVVVVVVCLVVVVLAEEVAVVPQRELVTGHQLTLAQGAPKTLDVVNLALGSHHKVRAAETQAALVALGTEQSAIYICYIILEPEIESIYRPIMFYI